MREPTDISWDDLKIEEKTVLHNTVHGNITVLPGGVLHLHGICAGKLIIEQNAKASVYGMVAKDILNSGQLEMFGVAFGLLHSFYDSETILNQEARVGGFRGKVILVCRTCSQKLRTPSNLGDMTVTCPKCGSSWSWSPEQHRKGLRTNINLSPDQQEALGRAIDEVQKLADDMSPVQGESFKNGTEWHIHKKSPPPKRPWWLFGRFGLGKFKGNAEAAACPSCPSSRVRRPRRYR